MESKKTSNYNVQRLEWDSTFFGLECGRLNLTDNVTEEEIKNIKDQIKDYTFVSIWNCNNRHKNNQWIGKETNAFLADVNIQFFKKINTGKKDKSVIISNHYPFDQEVLSIAENAYSHSKFIKDKKLKERGGERVYTEWIKNAFEKEDKYFLILKEKETAGYILFLMTQDEAVIELIATNECYRGQGIGRRMIQALEKFLVDHQIEKLNVGTQLDNIGAVNFYHHCGFDEVARHSVWHWWEEI